MAWAASPEPGSLGAPSGASSEQGAWGRSPLPSPRTGHAILGGTAGRDTECLFMSLVLGTSQNVNTARHRAFRHFCSKVLSKGRGMLPSPPQGTWGAVT